ncbi:MAG: hypothetical protein B6227_04235 [Fusobacteriia bacterium 4572_74]|nr:MAG: hypothetical protein B6227_04235 [Fusobacteriia bacterium 4572_74]
MIKRKILQIDNLSKSFPGVNALTNIDFDLFAGEIHCLVGENGAGKSTFIKILSGALVPDKGNIILFNKKHSQLTPLDAIKIGIQTVYQESKLAHSLSVAENVFLGNEILNRYKFIDLKKTYKKTKEILDSLKIKINPQKMISDLSIADKQIIGIVKALSREVKILILDEVTASLSASETERFLNLTKEITKKGVGIIFISHHLEEVFKIGDRITIFKDGKKINTHTRKEISHDVLVNEMIGRSADLFYKKEVLKQIKKGVNTLDVVNYSRKNIVENINFTIKSGEIFGIGGMVGSGRTELARLLFGVDRKSSGKLLFNGKDITPDSPKKAIKQKICLVTEDRQNTGLLLNRSIIENISIVNINLFKGIFINLIKESKKVRNLVEKLKIITTNIKQEVINLSGGNQQKIVLAKWLYSNCDIFIFDEPTKGIDIGAKTEIYKVLSDLIKQDKIIIMISSDMPELISISDRIGIMRKGSMVKILKKDEISEEKILSNSIGVK